MKHFLHITMLASALLVANSASAYDVVPLIRPLNSVL